MKPSMVIIEGEADIQPVCSVLGYESSYCHNFLQSVIVFKQKGTEQRDRYCSVPNPVWQDGMLLSIKLWSSSNTPSYSSISLPLILIIVGLNHHTRHELQGFPTESYYITLIRLEFHCRGGDGIGKARNGHQCSCACVLGNIIV